MGLVSEAAAVELGIQTREDGEARVRVSRSSGRSNVFLAGSTISGNHPLLVAERDNPWLPSALHHQVLFHPLWPGCLSARLYSSLFQANECGQRVLNHRLYNFGWFNTQSKFNILTSAFKIESLFLRHLEPCLPETTLEARCALERRPNWTRSVREMKCVLVVNV